jgi:hypothetical protein
MLVAVMALSAAAQEPDLAAFRLAGRRLEPAHLPSGRVKVGAAEFQVDREDFTVFASNARQPASVLADAEGFRATRLQFLHTYQPGPGIEHWRIATGLAHRKLQKLPDWPVVFSYRLTYADGETVTIPVRFGEGVEQWCRVQTVAPMLWSSSHRAHDLDPKSTAKAVVYAMDVPNPRPEVAVTAVDAVGVQDLHRDYGRALILAASHSNAPLSGKLYFVERQPLGSDSQPGTFAAPFGTLQKALDVAQPGDSVYMCGGVYALNGPAVKKFTGQKDKWLTISAFPGESPVLDGRHIHFDPRVKPYGPRGTDALGSMQHDTGALHLWGDPSYTRIRGLHIERSTRAGISLCGRPDPDSGRPAWASFGTTGHVDISFNTTWQTFSMGIISAQVNDITINGNRIFRPHAYEMARDAQTGRPVSAAKGAQEAIDLSRSNRFEIAFNTVAGGSKEAIDVISINDGSIHHNYVLSSLNGIYVDSWSNPIHRVDIYRNFIQDAFNGVPLATEGGNDLKDIKIHHNIIVDSRSAGIGVTEATYKAKPAAVQGHRVSHNTVHRSGAFAMSIGWQAAGIAVAGYRDNLKFKDVDVWNNIVTESSGMPMKNVYRASAEDHDIQFTHNLLWPTAKDTTPLGMRDDKYWVATDLEPGAKTVLADPLYVGAARGDFRLAEGSPAIGAGLKGEDIGALPHGQEWIPGLDFAGAVTAYYTGDTVWRPLEIPRRLCTQYRNNLQRPAWFHSGRYGADFRNLPDGERAFAGVTYLIPGEKHNTAPTVMTLAGVKSESKAASIVGIPVGRKARKLAFLHNAQITNGGALVGNAEIFRYRIHYRDGSQIDIPVRKGLEIEHWRSRGIRPLPNAKIAWTQRASVNGRRVEYLHIYQLIWNNPKPDIEIAGIDILRKGSDPRHATQATFAISTGH